MMPTMKKRGKTVLGVRMGLCRLFSKWSAAKICRWSELAGHLLPCFQSLLSEGSICRAARLLSDIGRSLKVALLLQRSLGRREGGELTSWPPALYFLLYLIVVLAI